MLLGLNSAHSPYIPFSSSFGSGPLGNPSLQLANCPQAWGGPSFSNRGYDQMFMPSPGLGFNSPLQFMMGLLRDMMSMMMGGANGNPYNNMPPMGQQPGFRPEWNYYPSPNEFWSNGNNEGYQNQDAFGSQGYQNGGTYSQNNQNTFGGYSRQAINGGFRSTNDQSHTYGHADQRVFGGNQSLTSQRMAHGTGNQIAATGHQARTTQTATNSFGSQTASTGHGSSTLQVANGGSVAQRIDAGHGSRNTQDGGTSQVIVAGSNSQNTQRAGNGATQVISAGSNSDNFIKGNAGNYQEANVTGNNSTTTFSGRGGDNVSVANVNGRGNTVAFGQGDGNVNRVNNSTINSNQVWTSRGAGMANEYQAAQGNDTLTIRQENKTDNNAWNVNMGAGNDRTNLVGLPTNSRQPMQFNGGDGRDAFTFRPDADGPYTIMRDGKVYHQVGQGGPTINVDGYESVSILGRDGKPVPAGRR